MGRSNIVRVQLPGEQPDCCAVCPLCGVIPKTDEFRAMRPKGSKETYICIGTRDALTGRGIRVRASKRDSHHPLRRYCDGRWDAWMRLPERKLGVSVAVYNTFRVPYEQSLELSIKFHR